MLRLIGRNLVKGIFSKVVRVGGVGAVCWYFGKGYGKKVNIYISTKNDIHFNLATEEYLFEHLKISKPTLFL